MSVRLFAASAIREIIGPIAKDAGIVTAKATADAFDTAILPHADIAALIAKGRAAPGFCSDLGRLFPGEPVYTVAIASGAVAADARAFARRLWEGRLAAGFEGVAMRRATGADTAAARDLVFGVLGEYGFAPDPDGIDADLMDLEAGFLTDGGMFDVGIGQDDRLGACCGMKILAEGRLELRKMYVRRDMRGQGLGQRLLDRALAWARARAFERVELETASVLKEAIALYRKAGFEPRPGKQGACRCDQAFVLKLG